MRVIVRGEVRGEPCTVAWEDGTISGDQALLRRLDHGATRVPDDVVGFIRAVERAVGQRPEIEIVPDSLDTLSAHDDTERAAAGLAGPRGG